MDSFYHVHHEWAVSPWRFLALRCVVLWALEDAHCFGGLISITVLRACHNAKRSWVLPWAPRHLPCVDHWSQPSFHCFWMPTYQFSLGREVMYTEAKTVNSVCRKRWIKSPVFFFVFTAHEWQGQAYGGFPESPLREWAGCMCSWGLKVLVCGSSSVSLCCHQ